MSINRKKQLFYAFLSLAVASGGGYLGYKVMEKRIVEQKYMNVVAVKKGHMIEPYTPILASDLTYLPMSSDYLIPGVYTDPTKVIGKRTSQRIGEMNPIIDWQLTDHKFLPDPKKHEWQYEFNLSEFGTLTMIRTGDTVGIWVKYQQQVDQNTDVREPILFKKTNPGADLLFTTAAAGIKDGEGAEVFSLLPPKLSTQVVGNLIEGVVEGSDTADRLAASFRGKPALMPAKILLNLTPQQMQVLQEAKQFGEWQIGVSFQGSAAPTILNQEGQPTIQVQYEGGRP